MSTLADYIRSKREDQVRLTATAESVKVEWVRQLEELMARIDQWLAPAVGEGLRVSKVEVSRSEERLGTYTAPARVIEFAGGRVAIEPVARVIVGGHGRVDVRSGGTVASLIYWAPEKGWFIVRERDWARREPLSEESFGRLMEAFL